MPEYERCGWSPLPEARRRALGAGAGRRQKSVFDGSLVQVDLRVRVAADACVFRSDPSDVIVDSAECDPGLRGDRLGLVAAGEQGENVLLLPAELCFLECWV